MLTAVVTAPELTMPWHCPDAALEEKPRRMLLLMFSVPQAPLFVMPPTIAVVAEAAVIVGLSTVLPFMFIVPGSDRFVMAVTPAVVATAPPCETVTVLLFMLIVAVASSGVRP